MATSNESDLRLAKKERNRKRYLRMAGRRSGRRQPVPPYRERWTAQYSLHDPPYCEYARRAVLDIRSGVFMNGKLEGKRVQLTHG